MERTPPWYRTIGLDPDVAYVVHDWLATARGCALLGGLGLVVVAYGGLAVGLCIRIIRLIGGI